MAAEHFFITGALGCLGAWTVRNLVRASVPVTVFDLDSSKHRLALVMSAAEISRVNFIQADITQTEVVIRAVQETKATHLIHLAALQVPACRANPVLGASVNVVGTINIFEAAKAAGIRQVIYASSVAVYGRRQEYPAGLVPHKAPLRPQTLYGVYKQANEETARLYWQDEAIASLALRPYIVYGPGRDQGLTSAPTKAMLAAAAGRPYHIPYGGTSGYQLADDVAKTFIQLARTPFAGAEVFNLKGAVVPMSDIVAAIELAAPGSQGKITYADVPLPFPDGQDDAALAGLLGQVPATPLAEGVAATIEQFRRALRQELVTLQ